jgi:hypothetical protein
MKEYIDVLDPTAATTVKQEHVAMGLNDLNGKVIGFVDNRKPNFDIFLEHVEAALRQQFQFAEVVHIKKGGTGATVPLTPAEMEQLAPKCDVIVYGICD